MRLAPLALIVVCATPACVDIVGSDFGRYVDRETKQFKTSGTPDIVLSTFDGSIEVRTWDKPDVEVVIERRGPNKESAGAIVVDAQQTGNRVSVEVQRPARDGFFHFGSRSAKLIVSAPVQANISAKSGDGSITVESVSGKVELRSGDGSIHGHALRGDIRAHTGDGSIRLDDLDGSLDAQTGDGSIVASGALRSLHARSGDGSVTIHTASTTPEADWDVSTGDGSIALEIPSSFNAQLDATTHDGRVNLQNVSVADVTGTLRHGTVQGRLGSGGRTVKLRTGDGSIRITSPGGHE